MTDREICFHPGGEVVDVVRDESGEIVAYTIRRTSLFTGAVIFIRGEWNEEQRRFFEHYLNEIKKIN